MSVKMIDWFYDIASMHHVQCCNKLLNSFPVYWFAPLRLLYESKLCFRKILRIALWIKDAFLFNALQLWVYNFDLLGER